MALKRTRLDIPWQGGFSATLGTLVVAEHDSSQIEYRVSVPPPRTCREVYHVARLQLLIRAIRRNGHACMRDPSNLLPVPRHHQSTYVQANNLPTTQS